MSFSLDSIFRQYFKRPLEKFLSAVFVLTVVEVLTNRISKMIFFLISYTIKDIKPYFRG